MLEIHETCEKHMESVRQFAERTGQSAKLQKQLDWLDKYAEHDERGKTKCVLYKDFAPHSFEFVMLQRSRVRQAYCPECKHHFDWEVKLSEHTPNISGEESIRCTKCSKKCYAGPQQENYKRWFNGGLIYHGTHDNGGDGGAPTFSVNLTPENGWSVHT